MKIKQVLTLSAFVFCVFSENIIFGWNDYWSTPVSAGYWSTPVSAGYWSTPVSAGYWSTPVSAGYWSTPVSAGYWGLNANYENLGQDDMELLDALVLADLAEVSDSDSDSGF